MKLRSVIRTAAVVCALSLLLGSPSLAQEHKHETAQDASTLKLSTDLVSLSVTVTDQKGQAITGLKREDFKIYENGVEQPLSFFSAEEAPVCWGIVLDRSGSMKEMIRDVYRAAVHVVDEGAEYFRDIEKKDVMFLVDNIFRYVQAGSEVSGLLGRLPSEVGYQPTLADEIAALEERIATANGSAITSIQAVYVPADDLTDPAVAHTFVHLDASIVLSRNHAAQGLYPAIDPLGSTSRLLDPVYLGEKHYEIALRVRETIEHYRALQDIVAMLGLEELSVEDQRTVRRARRLQRFLTQPLFVTEAFTGHTGRHVPVEKTIAGCEAILSGACDDRDEALLYMIGSIEEA